MVDRNPANADKDNAAFLCMPHHDQYDSVPSQSKRITPDELKAHRQSLCEALKGIGIWTYERVPVSKATRKKPGHVSPDVYNLRVPIYRATIDFLRTVNGDLNPKLGTETDEAGFLFDETIADYLSELAKKAVRLHALAEKLKMGFIEKVATEEMVLSVWFFEQFAETRKRFGPFLQLG